MITTLHTPSEVKEYIQTLEDEFLEVYQGSFKVDLFKAMKVAQKSTKEGKKREYSTQDLERIEKLAQIIDKIDDQLPDILLNSLRSSLTTDKRITELRGKSYNIENINIKNVLIGELFEQLVKAEFQYLPEKETSIEISALESQILDIWQNPYEYGLEEEVGRLRNPDLAYIEIIENKIVVKAVGEAKFGELDDRARKQLENFRNNLSLLIKKLQDMNASGKLKELNSENELHLDELIANIDQLSIASPLDIHIVVPFNRREINDSLPPHVLLGRLRSLIKEPQKNWSEKYRQKQLEHQRKLALLLTNRVDEHKETTRFSVVNSSFTRSEIKFLLNALLNDETYKTEIDIITSEI